MKTVSQKHFQCSFCGKDFSDTVAVGSQEGSMQDSDFRTHFPGLRSVPLSAHTCPFCGFTDPFHEKGIPGEERGRILQYLDSCRVFGESPGTRSQSQQYERLAKISELRNKPSVEIAQVYLNAAWTAEDDGNLERARQLRKHAEEYLIKALEHQEVEPERTPVIIYLVAELKRRLGEFTEAIEWFSRVITEDPRLTLLCRQQKYLATVQESVNTRMPAE
jgi:uncharacterized protein